jgi:hypothetical protein
VFSLARNNSSLACPKNKKLEHLGQSTVATPLGSLEPAPHSPGRGRSWVSTISSYLRAEARARRPSRSEAQRASPEPLSAPPSLGVEFGRVGGGGQAGGDAAGPRLCLLAWALSSPDSQPPAPLRKGESSPWVSLGQDPPASPWTRAHPRLGLRSSS